MRALKAGFDLKATVRSVACTLAILFLTLSPVEAPWAAGDVAIYSALGDPLVAEVALLPQERGASRFVVRQQAESGQQFEVERIAQRSALLLLSDTPVEQPILELDLVSDDAGVERERTLTLFLDPMPAGSASAYLRGLVVERNRALEQGSRPAQEQQQGHDTCSGWMEQLFSHADHSIFSAWPFFLLLGGIAALLLVWWWRSAEPMPLELAAAPAQGAERGGDSGIWSDFRKGVERIEKEIQPPPVREGE